MKQHKKAHSGASVHDALKRARQSYKDFSKKVGNIPKLSGDHHETQLRNHLRMSKSRG